MATEKKRFPDRSFWPLAAIVLLVWVVGDFVFRRQIILPRFERLENRLAARDLIRCRQVLRGEIHRLGETADWLVAWAERGPPDEAPGGARWPALSVAGHRPDLVRLYAADGRLLWPEEPVSGGGETVAPTDPDPLSAGRETLAEWARDRRQGFAVAAGGVMLLAVREVRGGDNVAPATLMIGRTFDDRLRTALAAETGAVFQLRELTAPDGNPVGPLSRRELSPQLLEVGAPFPDWNQRPFFRLSVELPRPLMAQGRAISRVVTLAGLALVLLVFVPAFRMRASRDRARHELADARTDLETERDAHRRTDDGLKRLSGTYRRWFRHAADPVAVTDPGGTILSASLRFCAICGLQPEEAAGRNIFTGGVFTAASVAEILTRFDRLARGDRSVALEVDALNGDGNTTPYELKAVSLPDAERGPAILFSLQELSRLRGARARLKEKDETLEKRVAERTRHLAEAVEAASRVTEKARDADSMKSQFLAKVSHEIRTPMTGILGTCELALDAVKDPRIRDYLGMIRVSARTLLDLINDILDFSKIESGKLEMEHVPFALRNTVEEVYDIFFEKVTEKEIEFVLTIAPDVPADVVADPGRLRQVLVNLISNAFKFTQKGEIVISVSRKSGGSGVVELLFSVRDTGIGIPADVRPLLFEAFVQADGSTTRRFGGTGLGLAICRQLVTLMGGRIWVESRPGKGSTFSFTLRLDSVDSRPGITAGDGMKLGPLRVLVVDDHKEARAAICALMESFGCRVEDAASGEEGIAAYERAREDGRPCELVLVDNRMSGMNGVELAARVKNDPEGSPPPVILITGYASEVDVQRLQRIKVDRLLIKPIKRSQLFEAVARTVGKDEAPAAVRLREAPDLSTDLDGMRVLLAEDNPINQRVLTEILQVEGVVVQAASEGRQALEILRREHFDAVLMDVEMPVMDGLEATRRIRSDPRLRRLPVVAMTAHAMSSDRDRCLQAGMNDFVAKPIDRQALFEALVPHRPRTDPHGGKAAGETGETGPEPRAVAGLDVQAGVRRLGGNRRLYIDILEEFCRGNRSAAEELKKCLDAGDLKRAAELAHSLKGAAGNLSAGELQEAAAALETACREGGSQGVDPQMREVGRALERVSDFCRLLRDDS